MEIMPALSLQSLLNIAVIGSARNSLAYPGLADSEHAVEGSKPPHVASASHHFINITLCLCAKTNHK